MPIFYAHWLFKHFWEQSSVRIKRFIQNENAQNYDQRHLFEYGKMRFIGFSMKGHKVFDSFNMRAMDFGKDLRSTYGQFDEIAFDSQIKIHIHMLIWLSFFLVWYDKCRKLLILLVKGNEIGCPNACICIQLE